MITLKNYRKKIQKGVDFITLITPFVLWSLPVDYFDKGQSLCLSKALAGVECYGCGITRGIMHLMHLDFEQAWYFNKISFIVLPLLFLLWLKSVYAILGKKFPFHM